MRIGPYEVLGEVGRGAAGVVYRALDPQGGEVALKLLAVGSQHDAESSQRLRFDREARVLAKVEHPAIVGIKDVGDHGGAPYLVMDLLTGRSLQDQLDADGPLQAGRAAEIVHEMAEALVHAHEQGVLHRDLKPGNVVLTVQGEPKLTDFGLAKDLDASLSSEGRLSVDGSFLGTPGYWAPEQASGRPGEIGPHTDVYGLGALLYGLLTARPPFVGGSMHELAIAAREQAPTPPSKLQSRVDRALEALCLRCLEKAPSDRYPSVAALAEALDRYLCGDSSEGRGGGAGRAEWGSFLLVGVCLLMVVLVGAGASWLASSGGDPVVATPTVPSPTASEPATPSPSVDPREAALERVEAGLAAVDEKDHERARIEFERAIALDPTFLRAHLLRARALGESDPVEELREYERLLKEHPESADVYVSRARHYGSQKEYEASVRDLDRALELDTEHVDALSYRAAARMLVGGAVTQALAELNHALSIDPDHAYALLTRGSLYVDHGESERGLADLDRVIALEPDLQSAYTNRGGARINMGDHRGALKDLDRAIELDPDDPMAYANRGGARGMLGDLEGAEADYARALELEPKSPLAYYNLGALRARNGQWQEAIAAYSKALELDPQEAQGWGNRGLARMELEDWAGAIEDIRHALELAPEHRFAGRWRTRLKDCQERVE